MKNKALDYLQQDFELHVDMIEILKRNLGEVAALREDGVLLYCPPGLGDAEGTYALTAETPAAGAALLRDVKDATLLTVHQDFLVDVVRERFHTTDLHPCWTMIYRGVPAVDERFDIRPLRPTDAEFVNAHYQQEPTADHIRGRIAAGVMHGIYDEDRLAGFMGMHSEGSLGLLVVLPEFRHRGYAAALEKYMIRFCLDRGWTPYGHVIDGNEPSLHLQQKVGWQRQKQMIFWMER